MKKLLIATVWWLGFAATPLQARPTTVDIMFYNVYNLFDDQHDEGKDDWTFLPQDFPGKRENCAAIRNSRYREECFQTDWNEESVAIKVAQLGDAIRAASERRVPDLLGLCEVENANVVQKLADELGYETFVMTDSPDQRGIDVALIYRENSGLKFIGKKEHVLQARNGDVKPTRNVLEVEFKVGNETLYVFVNHWPSQAAPAPVRVNIAQQVKGIIDQRMRANKNGHIVVMGDFNVIESDYPHPFNTVFLDRSAKNSLLDVHDLFKASEAAYEVKNKMPYGTYFYPPRMSWDRLDRFFVNHNLNNGRGLEVEASSYRIKTPRLIQQTATFDDPRYYSHGTVVSGVPYRANINAKSRRDAGFSDHFPIFMRLVM